MSIAFRSVARFHFARLRERLWVRPLASCLLSLFAAFVAGLADNRIEGGSLPDISADTLEALLTIISASMLVIAVFSVGAMLSAYASASSSATPRSFPLVVGDDVSQNALSTFIGSFIFSLVALVGLLNGFYGQSGRFVLFLVTLLVFVLVILSFVRWVDRIARLGRLGNTIDKVEAAADAALALLALQPTLGAKRGLTTDQGAPVYSATVGYVQNIDVAKLQSVAESTDGSVNVCARPGTFVTPSDPLAYLVAGTGSVNEQDKEAVIEAFVVGGNRTFEADPRFGLIVLSEIGSRALSPAVNDVGTAIDIIGTFVRLFVRWRQACDESEEASVKYDRVLIPAISLDDMFDDAFSAIARDGGGSVELVVRLQKAFRSLSLLDSHEMKSVAEKHATRSLEYAKKSLPLAEEYDLARTQSVGTDS